MAIITPRALPQLFGRLAEYNLLCRYYGQVSLIYVNPGAMGSRVPLLQHLHSARLPIPRLSIGAEVPPITVASEQIETTGLEHVTLKPSSTDPTSLTIGLRFLGRPGFRSGRVGSAILWVGSGSGF